MTDFSYSVDHSGTQAVARLTGDIDLATIADLESAIDAAREATPDGDIVLDMRDVTFIDSSGLRVLVTAHDRQVADEARMTIIHPSPPVLRVLEVTGLLTTMNVDDRHVVD
jgi:anti-anti-sigma factor